MDKKHALYLVICFGFVSCATVGTLPEKPASPPAVSPEISRPVDRQYYTVKKGDTLWGIARRFNVEIKALSRENNITSARSLKAGQRIYLPRSSVPKHSGQFIWPIKGKVVNAFGDMVDNAIFNGIGINASGTSREVRAASDGRVIFSEKLKGWGETIIIQHDNSIYTVYANLENNRKKHGMAARQGEVIASVAIGKCGDPILHFEIRKNALPQNPVSFLN